jgi:hypothetical protein
MGILVSLSRFFHSLIVILPMLLIVETFGFLVFITGCARLYQYKSAE